MWTRRQTLLTSFSVALLAVACAQNQKVVTETNTNETVVSSTPPFQTKEPQRYRATRTITTVNAAGETTVTTNLIARHGELRRVETQLPIQHLVYLYLPEGKFVLVPEEKLFAELTRVEGSDDSAAENDSESSPDRLLHTEPIATRYQQIGTDTVNGRRAQKYRVIVNSSAGESVSLSETFVWFDEALQMPIKSESRSASGTRFTSELSDIVLDVDKRLFEIPADYHKIDLNELQKRWKNTE